MRDSVLLADANFERFEYVPAVTGKVALGRSLYVPS